MRFKEKAIPFILFVLYSLLVYGYLKNKGNSSDNLNLIIFLSLNLLCYFLIPRITRIIGLRIIMFRNSIIWFALTFYIAVLGSILISRGIGNTKLIFCMYYPLIGFFFFQFMRIIFIILYNEQLILSEEWIEVGEEFKVTDFSNKLFPFIQGVLSIVLLSFLIYLLI